MQEGVLKTCESYPKLGRLSENKGITSKTQRLEVKNFQNKIL